MCLSHTCFISTSVEIVQSRVLELGSGAGFLGMIIADLQLLSQHSSNGEENAPSDPRRESLWMTDVDEQVLSRCRDNVNLPCSTLALSHGSKITRDTNPPDRSSFLSSGSEHPST